EGARHGEPGVRHARQVRAAGDRDQQQGGEAGRHEGVKTGRRSDVKQRSSPFASIEDAIEAFREGRMIIVVDDEDRENEGDLTIAAEKVTPESINFMARYGRGLICLS